MVAATSATLLVRDTDATVETVCRSQSLGVMSFAGRVSSLLAPFTSLAV